MLKYLYTFCIWPDEAWKQWTPQALPVWRMLQRHLSIEWTEDEFESVRSEFSRKGFTFREITRVPFQEEQAVY